MDTTAILEAIAGYNSVIEKSNNRIAVLDKQDAELDFVKQRLKELRETINQENYNVLSNTSFIENTGEWLGTKYEYFLEGRRTLIQYETEYIDDIWEVIDDTIPKRKKKNKTERGELEDTIDECRKKIKELEEMMEV